MKDKYYHVYQYNETGNYNAKRYNNYKEAEKDFLTRKINTGYGKLYFDYSDDFTVDRIAVKH